MGALTGTATNATITGCWVYWNDVSKLANGPGDGVSGTTAKYQLVGQIAGGLVGQVSGATTITDSLAATLIEGKSNAGSVGGLVGQWNGSTTTNPNISNSYADCYLFGTGQVAGLVGRVQTSVRLYNCYAAGFIMGHQGHHSNFPGRRGRQCFHRSDL